MKDCGGQNAVIKFRNSSISFLDNCDTLSESCSDLMPYQTAMLQMKVIKNSITVFDLKIDLCKTKKLRQTIRVGLGLFGIPLKCPIKEKQSFCYNNTKVAEITANDEKFLPLLFSTNQDFSVDLRIDHDTGTSCFQGEFNIGKKN
jgi:hypothetical protein